jgi:hypothetical protein
MLPQHDGKFNDEARMTNDEGSPNAQMIESAIGVHSSLFGFRRSFELRYSSLKTIFRDFLSLGRGLR